MSDAADETAGRAALRASAAPPTVAAPVMTAAPAVPGAHGAETAAAGVPDSAEPDTGSQGPRPRLP